PRCRNPSRRCSSRASTVWRTSPRASCRPLPCSGVTCRSRSSKPSCPALAHLRELERREYLHDRSDGAGRQYRFKHALTQEVAYASVLPADRRDLHARAVAALQTPHGGRLGAPHATLAHHAVRGQLWEKAVHYLRQTGVKAIARSASHEAV